MFTIDGDDVFFERNLVMFFAPNVLATVRENCVRMLDKVDDIDTLIEEANAFEVRVDDLEQEVTELEKQIEAYKTMLGLD